MIIFNLMLTIILFYLIQKLTQPLREVCHRDVIVQPIFGLLQHPALKPLFPGSLNRQAQFMRDQYSKHEFPPHFQMQHSTSCWKLMEPITKIEIAIPWYSPNTTHLGCQLTCCFAFKHNCLWILHHEEWFEIHHSENEIRRTSKAHGHSWVIYVAQKRVAKARFRTLMDVHVLSAGSAHLILIRFKHVFSKLSLDQIGSGHPRA